MARIFAEATLNDGSKVVSEFSKLGGIGNYSAAVMAGRKGFNAWRVVGTIHPASGEPCLVRERTVLNGSEIRSIREVTPLPGREQDHGYDPGAFQGVQEVQSGQYGIWRAPTNGSAVEGAVPGMEYPVHRDEGTLEKYVILRWAEDGEGGGEVRHYFERGVVPLGPGDGDDAGYGVAGEDFREDDEF